MHTCPPPPFSLGKDDFLLSLGHSIASVAEAGEGGMLVFLPNYSLLTKVGRHAGD